MNQRSTLGTSEVHTDKQGVLSIDGNEKLEIKKVLTTGNKTLKYFWKFSPLRIQQGLFLKKA